MATVALMAEYLLTGRTLSTIIHFSRCKSQQPESVEKETIAMPTDTNKTKGK
jgi:hypothetical protein